MVQGVATDERPLETPSSDESGLGRDSPSDDSEPEAALVTYRPYINTIIVLIVIYHICVVISGFEKIQCRTSSSHRKAVRIQTDPIETKSECIEACTCDAPI
ncbi:unnamed protein product [Euphydryas editha]|uniref:Uncharacterized protein n=1 Tax=Euphydryas editha TaxID=104508 RepID=A0AAU9TGQ4_EUPED|nr:unnamed protein product [Euphydryas editha]